MMNAPGNPANSSVEILDNGKAVRLSYCAESSRFHALWLRDNGQDDATRNPANGQKLVTLQEIPENTTVSAAHIDDGLLHLQFSPDNKQTHINLEWLWHRRYDRSPIPELTKSEITTWDGSLGSSLPQASFQSCLEDPGTLLRWLKGIERYGVAVLDDLPQQNAAVLEAIRLFGYVRETNYGPYFEIRSEIDPINLAYTNLGLQSHTDNPYREPVPGLQFFGCIENNADGGESVVVDGFRIAEVLHGEDRECFELLASFNANFEYAGSTDTHLLSHKPMIEVDANGALQCVRFNNRSCAALTEIPYDNMERYYHAYRRFGDLVNDPALEVVFKLEPRQLFVTDNTRVLHGRTGFSGAGHRWMQGAYADKDSLKSRIRILEREINDG